ncbi:MAG: putative endonuclease [Clostridiales bacterium]|nr:putative endonuclease [Clostridiales bacterium]MDK2932610.1 putative endonuclease [Clostridiales bacterium]
MKNYKKLVGALGEDIAVKYLLKKNYKILERNFHCKLGEIDIIAKEGAYIVFIEVKTRKNTNFGVPSEAVNYYKQKKIMQIAQYYLMVNKLNVNVRFDVIEIIAELKENKPLLKSIRLIKNAF